MTSVGRRHDYWLVRGRFARCCKKVGTIARQRHLTDLRQARRDDWMTGESLLEDTGLPDDQGADTLTVNPRGSGSR